MAASDVNTAMAAAIAALESGDLATALTKALAAQGYLAAMPNSSTGETELSWSDARIQQFVENLRRQQTVSAVSTNGLRRSKTTYVRATD